MPTAKIAVAQSLTRTRSASLARAPSIPLRRQGDAPAQKRIGIVLRRGMLQREYRQVEARLDARNVTRHAIMFGHKKTAPTEGAALCGLIITGGDMTPTADERALIVEAVQDSIRREAPVLALSDAAAIALEAAGLETPAGQHCAVLIDRRGVHLLLTPKEIDAVIDQMTHVPMR